MLMNHRLKLVRDPCPFVVLIGFELNFRMWFSKGVGIHDECRSLSRAVPMGLGAHVSSTTRGLRFRAAPLATIGSSRWDLGGHFIKLSGIIGCLLPVNLITDLPVPLPVRFHRR